MRNSADYEARLAELRVAYVGSLPGLLAQYASGVAQLREGSDDARDGMRVIAHQLAGSGGLHGAAALMIWGKETERLARYGDVEQLAAAGEALAAIIGSLG